MAGIVTIVLMLVVFYEVFMRFVLVRPVSWAEEVPRLLFLVIMYLGLAYTTRIGGHVTLDVIITRLPEHYRGLLQVITSLTALVVTFVLLWQATRILNMAIKENWHTSTTVPVIQWPFLTAMVIGSIFMSLEWIGKIVDGWRQFRHSAHIASDRRT